MHVSPSSSNRYDMIRARFKFAASSPSADHTRDTCTNTATHKFRVSPFRIFELGSTPCQAVHALPV
eukprot:199472-Amphidinium_carterae.1